jgi:hypothetical protein
MSSEGDERPEALQRVPCGSRPGLLVKVRRHGLAGTQLFCTVGTLRSEHQSQPDVILRRMSDLWRVASEASERFAAQALDYHRYRPRYPEGGFDDIVRLANLSPGDKAIEIGAGTGIATQPLVERGLDVTAIEPAAALAAVAGWSPAPSDQVPIQMGDGVSDGGHYRAAFPRSERERCDLGGHIGGHRERTDGPTRTHNPDRGHALPARNGRAGSDDRLKPRSTYASSRRSAD